MRWQDCYLRVLVICTALLFTSSQVMGENAAGVTGIRDILAHSESDVELTKKKLHLFLFLILFSLSCSIQ